MNLEWKIARSQGRGEARGAETASLNNILRRCKERLLGHYRRWLTILTIWLGQCHVSDLDSLASVLRLFPLSSLPTESLASVSACLSLPRWKKLVSFDDRALARD